MGWLSSLFRRPEQAAPDVTQTPAAQFVINNPAGDGTVPAALLPATGRGFFVEVKGESHYQDVLRAYRAESGGDNDTSVILVPEPTNPHDANAVAVKTFQNDTVGYVGREEAARYQPTLIVLQQRGLTCVCAAQLRGGTGAKKSIGVWLDLEGPMAVAAKFGVPYQRQPARKETL